MCGLSGYSAVFNYCSNWCVVYLAIRRVFPRECSGFEWHQVADSLKDFLLYCCYLSVCWVSSFSLFDFAVSHKGVEMCNVIQSSVHVCSISANSKKFVSIPPSTSDCHTICLELINKTVNWWGSVFSSQHFIHSVFYWCFWYNRWCLKFLWSFFVTFWVFIQWVPNATMSSFDCAKNLPIFKNFNMT